MSKWNHIFLHKLQSMGTVGDGGYFCSLDDKKFLPCGYFHNRDEHRRITTCFILTLLLQQKDFKQFKKLWLPSLWEQFGSCQWNKKKKNVKAGKDWATLSQVWENFSVEWITYDMDDRLSMHAAPTVRGTWLEVTGRMGWKNRWLNQKVILFAVQAWRRVVGTFFWLQEDLC